MPRDVSMTSLGALLPARLLTDRGTPRHVGVEIELAGLELDEIAAVVAGEIDGDIVRRHDYELAVETELGSFRIERDLELLQRWGREREAADHEPPLLERLAHGAIESLARQVAPCELVTPPLPFDRLPDVDRIGRRLRELGAEGTADGLLYAFGVHFNPEAPSLGADDMLAHLRAFIVLYPWLRSKLDVDLARRATPFIDPFPIEYCRLVANPRYAPDRSALIDDYLAWNPTRDRALDMLCLFAHLDPERVFAVVHDERVHPRPTYHYRLSNCAISDPAWHPSDGWRYWLVVEDLASDRDRLAAIGAAYRSELARPLAAFWSHWDDRIDEWLQPLNSYERLRDAPITTQRGGSPRP